MDCYIEWLSGCIRIGPHAHRGWPEGPDPYELSIAFSANKGWATLKGLAIPKTRIIHPDGSVTEQNRYSLREGRDIFDVVHRRCREARLEPIYERIKSNDHSS